MYQPNIAKDQFGKYSGDGVRSFMFTVAEYGSPSFTPLFDTVLVLQSPPQRVEITMAKSKNTANTYGGVIEWHWPDEFDTISGSMSTGGFLTQNGYLGHVGGQIDRRQSTAYLKFQDFLALFQNNGCVFDSMGKPVLRGRVLMSFDRGIFSGFFTTFTVEEADDKPFSFSLSWDFKVERQILKVR
jgi:hypothetical protein